MILGLLYVPTVPSPCIHPYDDDSNSATIVVPVR